MGRVGPAFVALAAALALPAVPAPAAADNGWRVVDGDMVVHDDAVAPSDGPQPAVPASGPGYTTFIEEQNTGAFTFVLDEAADAAGYRPELEAIATELNGILGPLGGAYDVAAGTVTSPADVLIPAVDVDTILVLEATNSPCASMEPDWIGCGGPRISDISAGQQVLYATAGVVWLRDTLHEQTADVQAEVVRHEIGHALGLGHYELGDFEGQAQIMRPGAGAEGANQTYQSGDSNGLLAQHPFPIGNDAFASPRILGPEATATAVAVPRFASAEVDEPDHAGAPAARSTWFTFTAPRSGFTTVSTEGANFDSRVAVYTGTDVAALTPVASNDDGPGLGAASLVGFEAVQGTTYRIAVDGTAPSSFGAVVVGVRPPSTVACDDVSTACVVPPGGVRVQAGSTAGTTEEFGEPDHAAPTINQNFLGTVWYRWTAPRSGPVRITGQRSGTVPFMGLYTGPNVLSLTPVAATQSTGPGLRRFDFTAVAGTTYRIALVRTPSTDAFTLTVDPGFGGLTPVTPARILETRSPPGCIGISCPPGGGRWPPNQPLSIDVTGVGGVPEIGVNAVVLNVTAADAIGSGFLTLYPTGQSRPTASNLNYAEGRAVANLVTVKTGGDGRINIFSNAGFPNVIADVVGWYGPGSGSLLTPVTPARIQDSRTGPGITQTGLAGPWTAGQARTLQVSGRGGVPVGATAVVLNVTATGTTGNGFLTVFPADVSRPTASNLNFVVGQTVPNLVVVGLDAAGRIKIYNHAGATHVVADVVGYYGGVGGTPVTAVAPVRLLDTRQNLGLNGAFTGQQTRDLTVLGGSSPVRPGATGVLLNVTVTGPTVGGFLTAFPADSARPNASNLNFVAGQTVPNLVLVKIGAGGAISLYNHAGLTHVIADVVGFVGG